MFRSIYVTVSVITIITSSYCAPSSSTNSSYLKINFDKPINFVSEKFLSYSIEDPRNGSIYVPSEGSRDKNIGPAYIKLTQIGEYYKNGSVESQSPIKYQSNLLKWKKLYDWMIHLNVTPIFPLEYDPKTWDPQDVLRILLEAYKLNLINCNWQLGSVFSEGITAEKYSTDLRTLRVMINAFNVLEAVNWGLNSAEITSESDNSEIEKFTNLVQNTVESVGWIDSTDEYSSPMLNKSNNSLRIVMDSETPIWLTIPSKKFSNSNKCNGRCIREGLQWAQMLGDAAKTGFHGVFKTIQLRQLLQENLSHYISLLYKKTIGQIVFDTKITRGDKKLHNFYTHCSPSGNGSFSIMGINMSKGKKRFSPKIRAENFGNEMQQYLLTVQNGIVLLNGEPIKFNKNLKPLIKQKKAGRSYSLHTPSMSIGFWVFPKANLTDCKNIHVFNENLRESQTASFLQVKPKTSLEILLQKLIVQKIAINKRNDSNNDNEIVLKKRHRRQINKLLKHLPKIKLNDKFSSPIFGQIGQQQRNQPNNEQQIFEPRPNPDIPNGDVLFEVGRDDRTSDYDYVEFNENPPSEGATKSPEINLKIVQQKEEVLPPVDTNHAYVPNEYFENFGLNFDERFDHQPSQQQRDEIFEIEQQHAMQNGQYPAPQSQPQIDGRKIDFIMKEMEPTWKQNQENYEKSKQNLNQFYVLHNNKNSGDDHDDGSPQYLPPPSQQQQHQSNDDDGRNMSNDDDMYERRRNPVTDTEFTSRRKKRSILSGKNDFEEIKRKLRSMLPKLEKIEAPPQTPPQKSLPFISDNGLLRFRRRAPEWDGSWEMDNSIPKEINTKSNNFLPVISVLKDEEKSLKKLRILTELDLPDGEKESSFDHREYVTPATTFNMDNEDAAKKGFERWMKILLKSFGTVVKTAHKHILGWWNMMG